MARVVIARLNASRSGDCPALGFVPFDFAHATAARFSASIEATCLSGREPSMRVFAVTIAAFAVTAGAASAQTPAAADPGNMARFGRAIKARYDAIKRDIVDATEAMPESEYGFRATPQVRTFAEIIRHVADSQNFFCGVAGGGNPEYADPIEKSGGTKATLVKALKDSVATCDEVYGTTDPANALALVPAGKGDALRGMMLLDNVSHDNEHYGNIVTYMRLKGHVPPSTARGSED
jgi:uncharacterized damage-inducible protein DinB